MSDRESLRVLMISGRADFGGGPEHVYQLTKNLGNTTQVYVACPREEPYWTRFMQILGQELMMEIPHRRISLAALLSLIRFISNNDVDIVHAHGRAAGIYGRIAAFIAGKQCCYTPHGGTPIRGLKTLCYAVCEFLLSLITAKVIAVSHTEAKGTRWLCARSSQLEVIPNGVEIPDEFTSRGISRGNQICVLHATRFVYQKNSELLLNIIQRLRELGALKKFHFTILGDGPGRIEFESLLRAYEMDDELVSLEGAVPNPGDYMAGTDCMISTSRWEGLPLVVLEAMARGIPVVATDVTGNRDAVTDGGTGFLYDLTAPEHAAARLVELANDPQLRERLSCGARKRAENEFSVNAMAQSTRTLYQKLSVAKHDLANEEKITIKKINQPAKA